MNRTAHRVDRFVAVRAAIRRVMDSTGVPAIAVAQASAQTTDEPVYFALTSYVELGR